MPPASDAHLHESRDQIDEKFKDSHWYNGAYVGFAPGSNQGAPAVCVQVLPGAPPDVEQLVRKEARGAAVQIVPLLDRPSAWSG